MNNENTSEGLTPEQMMSWQELICSPFYQEHIDEKDLINILIQLVNGLIEYRNKGITYFDISPKNVCVSEDGIYTWSNSGISYPSTPDHTIPKQLIGADGIVIGNQWLMAPETYRNGIFTESSAIYSLAMLAYYIMNGMQSPFMTDSQSGRETLNKRFAGLIIPQPANSEKYKILSKFICNILNSDKSKRIKTFDNFKTSLNNELKQVKKTIWNPYGGTFITKEDNGGIPSNPCCAIPTTSGAPALMPYPTEHSCPTPPPPCAMSHSYRNAMQFPDYTFTPENNSSNHPDYESSLVPSLCSSAPIYKFGSVFKSIVNRFRKSKPMRGNDSKTDTTIRTDINACVYAPAEVRPRKSFIIRVYMYRHEELNLVDAKIKDIDPRAVKKEYKPLDLPVKEGDKLTIQLNLSEGVRCVDTLKSIIWHNHYTDCSFMAKLINENQDSIEGTVRVFINDVPAGEMLFTVDVVDSEPKELYTKVESRRFSKIFISYAHQDENQVRGIAEGCRMLGTDYFFDRHSLHAGDVFKEKIFDYINKADLFVLCWSRNAAASEWVQIEREHALFLIKEGKSNMSIYPLSIRPEAPLPIDMSDKYNFGEL